MSQQIRERLLVGVIGLFAGAVVAGLLQIYFVGAATIGGIGLGAAAVGVLSTLWPRILDVVMHFLS